MALTAPVGVAIIGGGIFVKTQHLPAVLKSDQLSIKAIYSRSLKSAQETADLITKDNVKPDLYSSDSDKSYQDLLQREDISAVIIALPITAQPKFIRDALDAGKHVLAEKPIAKDVETAKALIDDYHRISGQNGATFAVAENFRFYPSFTYAAEEARKFGKVNHFSVRVMFRVDAETNKYYQTEWRKKPEHQGGFLLDGGVHYVAGARLLLTGSEANKPDTVQAFSHQVEEHLPPIDSITAIIKTQGGGTGVFQYSAGTLLSAFEWDFGYENGTVKVSGETVTVTPRGGEAVFKEFNRTMGVSEEVAAWAQSLVDGKPNPLQSPEQALDDLEFLEKIFRSGEQNGSSQKYQFV
ncbi:hypothetical protein PT974_03269 [Cladobotryum mycophilum]|uniref:Uncharacterized protein n=1 Tax=Cladobotryum mycophilum TaxID=491253 RepID=A0ABR0SRT7_9HYPO